MFDKQRSGRLRAVLVMGTLCAGAALVQSDLHLAGVNACLAASSSSPAQQPKTTDTNEKNRAQPAWSQPASAIPEGESFELSLKDCLVMAITNHPDLAVTELADGQAGDPTRPLFAVKLAKNLGLATTPKVELLNRINAILYDTEKAYLDLILARDRRRIRQEMLKYAKTSVKETKRRILIDASEVDVRLVQANMQARLSELSFAEEQVEAAEDRLKLLLNDSKLGLPSGVAIIPTTAVLTERVMVDLYDQILTALKRRGPSIEGDLNKADRASHGRIILEVKDACRRVDGAWERMAIEAKCVEEWTNCLKVCEMMKELRAITPGFINKLRGFEERLTLARLRHVDAKVAYMMAFTSLGRATRTLHERHILRLKLEE